jgi:WD40 repeat protein/TPR repeat protein
MFSPDGRRIVTASEDGTARIWDAATGKSVAVLSGHGEVVHFAAFSPDGRRIVIASEDGTARIWDAATGKSVAVLSGHGDTVRTAAFSPDGQRIVTASFDATARIWGAASGMQLAVLADIGEYVGDAAYSPDGQRIVIASDQIARIWDPAALKQIAALSGHTDFVRSVAFSPDERRILTASNDWTARIWDAAGGAQLAVLSGHGEGIPSDEEGGNVRSAAFSPDGQRIVTASNDKSARIWDAATGKQLAVLSGHDHAVRTAMFSPDGKRIVTASADQTARIWDAAEARLLDVISGHADMVWSAAFSPDGQRIVTASFDDTVRVWDAATAKPLAVLPGHRDDVWSAAWSPDGRRIVTASVDRTARIWDAAGGAQLAVLSGHGDGVWSAAWSPDGRRIITTSADQTVRIWDANVPADLDTQLAWSQAAKFDELSDIERSRLGLRPDARIKTWTEVVSKCDSAAAATHDPDRRAPGFVQTAITADLASSACAQESAEAAGAPRLNYQLGRALLAKRDVEGAKREFERALSGGYRAAQVDLANLLADASAGTPEPDRALSLYEKAWRDGVPVAAFQLGQLYELGIPGAAATAAVVHQPDLSKAWSWYRKGAQIGEPNALARFGERHDASAVSESSPQEKNALLLKAFASYAAAAEQARLEDWPDNTWKQWRYRRANLARLLAREGMMSQVAGAYVAVRDNGSQGPPPWLEE